ncbi:hypothetical protein GGX14DRAFT_534177 [Mycena pura]|uniref:C2H2-type domain-containing protein n=1 Tax=Mycena pura TaxID=153505 RepID=A0AAD6YF10_9AGAR|nr:hypothetical protein GGX14DRAFT_534177 [Mycena pura]
MPPIRKTTRNAKLPCPHRCGRRFRNVSGRTQHVNAEHAFDPRVGPRHKHHSPPPSSPPSPSSFPASSPPPQNDIPMREDTPESTPRSRRVDLHPHLTDQTGRPCDRDGNFLDPDAPPPPKAFPPADDFSPYRSLNQFRMADFLYRKVQMSAGEIDELMEIMDGDGNTPSFAGHEDLYATIDATEQGHVAWQAFEVAYDGPDLDVPNAPAWKRKTYTVYFRDPHDVLRQQLTNPDFKNELDLTPQQVYDENGDREYKNFMSGQWAWRQADIIAQDPSTHGSVFVPVISGSDKTTTSVATGQNDFYPLYLTNGLVHNTVRRAHRNAVSLIGFLATPKSDREHQNSADFRTFRRQLFHASLEHIFSSLKPGMTTPEVALFGDGHYRKVVYGLGPYIADYPEQVLLACVVQGWCARCHASNKDLDGDGGRRTQAHTEALFDAFGRKVLWDKYGVLPDVLPYTWNFPRADIHELLSPDLLHQIIKGTFKDHLVTWVGEYLERVHGKTAAEKIMADIDRRIAAVPPFPGLRRFPEGRGFKQWTGDDSKALMKVYLPALEGHVPAQMLRAFSAFLDFCYLVRRNVINDATLRQIEEVLAHYHTERTIFEESGVCPTGFCLPRQHSLTHYVTLITEFAAPNGLCSSITESKHIKAVKEPWRRSSKYQALHQMLTINDRLDNLASTRVDFEERGILHTNTPDPTLPVPVELPKAPDHDDEDHPPTTNDDDEIEGEVRLAKIPIRGYPRDPVALADFLDMPTLPRLLRRFLYTQLHPDEDISEVDEANYPSLPASVMTYPSAIATFYAPSDQSSSRGLLHERIRAVSSWRGGPPRYDCVYVSGDDAPGFRGLLVARTLLFMSLRHNRVEYPCALVTWFSTTGDGPDANVGMWMVEPDLDDDGDRALDIIHIDTILRAAHLIPVFGEKFLPTDFNFTDSLDSFEAYYANRFADHHAHELVF